MNSLLSKIQKSASFIELRSIESLQLETPYAILKMVMVPTRFGPSVQVHLREFTDGQLPDEKDVFRVYLPSRISASLTEQDVELYNANQEMLYTLVYHGKMGKTFLVDFY